MAELIIPDEFDGPVIEKELPRMESTSPSSDTSGDRAKEKLELNPGTLDDFHEECRKCMGSHFSGLQVILKKDLVNPRILVRFLCVVSLRTVWEEVLNF